MKDQISPISRGVPKHRRELDRWLRSALMDPKRAVAYGVRALPAHEVEAFLGYEVGAALGFEYRGELHRVRLLEPGDDTPKYLQPAGTSIRVLEPLGHAVSELWDGEGRFPALFLTEGEKKAHALTELGFPCLGLGGVDAWRTPGGRELHEVIEKHRARAGLVVVVFDSNRVGNPDVARAEAALVKALRDRGSEVKCVALPKRADGTDQGIDDHLEPFGERKARVDEVVRLVSESEDAERGRVLALNERWKYIVNGGAPYVLEGLHRYKLSTFDAAYAEEKILTSNLKGNPVEKRLTQWWRVQPLCEKYERVGFHTSRTFPAPPGELNLYVPPSAPARYRAPSMKPVGAFLESAIPNVDERRWLLSWVAYAVQTGDRAHWCVFAWGPQGTGKTFLGVLLGACFVPYYKPVQIGDLARENFGNKHFERVRFLHADEGSNDDEDGRMLANRIKAPITQGRLEIEDKNIPSYAIDNRAMLYLSSNFARSLHVEKHDRRTFVLELSSKPPVDEVRDLNALLRESPSIDAPISARASWALWEFFERYPICDGFDPNMAPSSDAKDRMIDSGRSASERRINELMETGAWCGMGMPEVVSTEVLAMLLLGEKAVDQSKLQHEGVVIGRALAQAGARVRVIRDGAHTVRRWAVRNAEAWEKRSPAAWLEESKKLPRNS